jgi:hypothetical protein
VGALNVSVVLQFVPLLYVCVCVSGATPAHAAPAVPSNSAPASPAPIKVFICIPSVPRQRRLFGSIPVSYPIRNAL